MLKSIPSSVAKARKHFRDSSSILGSLDTRTRVHKESSVVFAAGWRGEGPGEWNQTER